MKKLFGIKMRIVVVLIKEKIYFIKLNALKKRNQYSEIFISICILAQTLRTNSERKKAEGSLVCAAVSEMKNIDHLDAFIRVAALHSTKNLAVEIYSKTRWIINLKEFPGLAKKIDVKKCGGKKAMKTLVNIMMPRFKNIQHATSYDLSRMANVIHVLPEKERNETLENISKTIIKKARDEKEFFHFLEMITDLLAHNCMIAHFATSGKMKTLGIAEKVLEKIRGGHPSADAAIEAVIIESMQLFKKAKLPEIDCFLNAIKKQKVTKKLQAVITKAMMEK
jgi:hypothetical protein